MSEDELRVLIRQLQGAMGGLAFRVGIENAIFTAANNTGSVPVVHGLGKVPAFIDVFPTLASVPLTANYISASRTDTDFEFRLDTADGSSISTTVGCFWIVMG